jgi:hypothetical protein
MTSFQKRILKTPVSERELVAKDGYDVVSKKKYAFISTRDTVYDLLKMTRGSEEICALKEIPVLNNGYPLAHFIAKNSPFKEIFRYW